MKKVICFDLEGPLSPMDYAYEVMKFIPAGDRVFEVISRYDDILTLEQRANYESGDTLKLIVPFLKCGAFKVLPSEARQVLICGNSEEADFKKISDRAILVNGAKELISRLRQGGWQVFIISTSYEHHALRIARRLGVSRANVFCTKFPLGLYRKEIDERSLLIVDSARDFIASDLWIKNLSSGKKDKEIKEFLDEFFWGEVTSDTEIKKSFGDIRVMGGARKVEALKKIAERSGVLLENLAAVGDSITDFKMLQAVDGAGGLAIVFNGNEYALPYGTVGLATTNIMDLRKILDAWKRGGREAVKVVIRKTKPVMAGPYYHWLVGKTQQELSEILKIHKKFRKIVRKKAAKLG